MSSEDLERVMTLEQKGIDLHTKGHVLRAAEYFSRAVEAARCLGTDNLVLVAMQLLHSQMLGAYAVQADMVDAGTPECLAAHQAESVALVAAAVDALERRHAAGTLQPGACTAAEEAWRAAAVRRVHMTGAEAARFCRLVGYRQVFYAAGSAASLLYWSPQDCTHSQLESFVRIVAHAAALLSQSRDATGAPDVEVRFFTVFRSAAAAARVNGLDARLAKQLVQSWQGLQRSGVLEARRIDESSRVLSQKANASVAALRRSLTAPGLRSCGLSSCDAREAHPQHFKSCAACRVPAYCCKEHQTEDWPAHKAACKAARKAAAAKTDDNAGPSGA